MSASSISLRNAIALGLLVTMIAACGSEPTSTPVEGTVGDRSPTPRATATDPERTPTTPPTESPQNTPTQEEAGQTMALSLSSSAFDHQSSIPSRYTCDGEDISPPLDWGEAPSGTQAYALIMDDPDAPAGTWDHWVLYNIPASVSLLEAGIPPDEELPNGALHGRNSWQDLGYGGPCPPDGTHRYFFRLYALDSALDLSAGANKEQVLEAMEGHILGQAELMGTYTR